MANARPSAFDRDAVAALRGLADEVQADPKEDAAFQTFAEGVSATLGWLLGEAPHPALQDLLDLAD